MMPAAENTPENFPQPEGMAGTASVPTPLTDRAIWWEVLAVLAIGVFPNLAGAVVTLVHPPSAQLPYWLNSLALCIHSACVSFAVLYLIYRSGEPWSSFGMSRPRFSDLGLGLLLFLVDYALWLRVSPVLPSDLVKLETLPVPKGTTDYILMVVKHGANGFAEELVTRAYLITRLERLLKSRFQAVTLSAVLFASYHLYYGLGGSLVYVLLFGLVYGGLYLLLRRVWPFAIGHMFINILFELDRSLN